MKKKTKAKSFIALDKHNLDEEWVGQPAMFRRYSRLLAEATRSVEMAKASYDVTMAEVCMDIRMNYSAYNLKKQPSDPTTKQVALTEPRIRKAQQVLIDAKFREDQLQADVNALAQRKSALQDLVVLFLQDYWAEPRVKGDTSAREHVEELARKEHLKRGRIVRKKVKDE